MFCLKERIVNKTPHIRWTWALRYSEHIVYFFLLSEVERRCAEENGPVFVTKNGYGRLVVMDIEYYEKTMRKMYEAKTILDGLEDAKSGNTVDGDTAISNIRSKYGI